MSISVIVRRSPNDTGTVIGLRLAQFIKEHPQARIGVATGSSPLPIYRTLAHEVDKGLDVSQVSWYALDEYAGLPSGHPQSYRFFLEKNLMDPMKANPDRLHTPDALSQDLHKSADRYEELLADSGGIDIQILGIGINGHIGFNEPGTPFDSLTHVGELTESTRLANSRFFGNLEDVPTLCLTQGLATIMRAKHIVLIAGGKNKASAIAGALLPPPKRALPASVLQNHPSTWFVIDEEAASQLDQSNKEVTGSDR